MAESSAHRAAGASARFMPTNRTLHAVLVISVAIALLSAVPPCSAAAYGRLGAGSGHELVAVDDATCHVQLEALSPKESEISALLAEVRDEEEDGARDKEKLEEALLRLRQTEVVDHVLLKATQGVDGLSVLVTTVMIKDQNRQWSPSKKEQPDWAQDIFARNLDILHMHGHGMVAREATQPLELLPWQIEKCNDKTGDSIQAIRNYDRENANWQKEALLAKYLAEPNLTHVAVLDADAVLTQLRRDTLRELAQELDREDKDFLVADEDWRSNGVGHINGGFILVKVTDFSKAFFRNLTLAHEDGPHPRWAHACTSNEQLCLQAWIGRPETKDRVLIKSGSQYNCHPKVLTTSNVTGPRSIHDGDLHVIHFMGAAKAVAPRYLAALSGSQNGSTLFSRPATPSEPPSTCNDGEAAAACFTVDECLATPPLEESPSAKRFAFVLTHSLEKESSLHLPYLESMQHAAKQHGIDILLLVPEDAPKPLSANQTRELSRQGVEVRLVPWTLPPRMRFVPKGGWCGRRDLIRLHSFNLTDYAAVAYYDTDIQIQGDVLPALECASRGHFLTTSGPLSPLNLGFMAFAPSSSLFQAAMEFAERADWSRERGWADGGFTPQRGPYPGYWCGQGFMHTLLYKKTKLGVAAMRRAGVRLDARQLDRCEWNYQLTCPTQGFQCSSVRAHHKGGGKACWKYHDDRHLFEL